VIPTAVSLVPLLQRQPRGPCGQCVASLEDSHGTTWSRRWPRQSGSSVACLKPENGKSSRHKGPQSPAWTSAIAILFDPVPKETRGGRPAAKIAAAGGKEKKTEEPLGQKTERVGRESL